MQTVNIKKLHHYLPRFYLKHFSNRKDEQLYQYKIKDKSHILVHPNVVGAENFLYAFRKDNKPVDSSLEDFFSTIDGNSSVVINKIVSNPGCVLSTEDNEWLLSFLSFMHLRIPELLDSLAKITKDLIYSETKKLVNDEPQFQQIVKELNYSSSRIDQVKDDIKHFKDRFKIDVNRNFILYKMFDQFPLIYSFLNMYQWKVLISGTNSFFITSDNPLSIYERHTGLIISGGGFQRPNVEISFPISNHLCLIGRISKPQPTIHYKKVNNKIVDLINYRTIINAGKYVFSSILSDEITLILNLKKEKIYTYPNAGAY